MAVGLCGTHYQRVRRGIPLQGPSRRHSKATEKCGVAGCERNQRARGWCDPHYKKWLTHGDPLAVAPRKKRVTARGSAPGRRFLDAQGYAHVYWPEHPNARRDGKVSEHVVVMSEHLGRPLLAGENVHHRNGQRADNRVANLELWAKVQPAGQRVSDLVRFANEITERYGTDPAAFQ
jgi:hypothetical protein